MFYKSCETATDEFGLEILLKMSECLKKASAVEDLLSLRFFVKTSWISITVISKKHFFITATYSLHLQVQYFAGVKVFLKTILQLISKTLKYFVKTFKTLEKCFTRKLKAEAWTIGFSLTFTSVNTLVHLTYARSKNSKVDATLKLNVHKTFIPHPGRHINVSCTCKYGLCEHWDLQWSGQ